MRKTLNQEELIAALTVDGKIISMQKQQGNEDATKIINYYEMWHICPGDMMSYVLCEEAYAEWKDKQNSTSEN